MCYCCNNNRFFHILHNRFKHSLRTMVIAIFVYGTFKKSFSRNFLLKKFSAEFFCNGILQNYAMYDLGEFPGIRPRKDSTVKGEIFKINNKFLEYLDYIENSYNRTLVKIHYDKDKMINCFTYIFKFDLKDEFIIKTGNWTE